MVIAARCPTGASDKVKKVWNDGLTAVDEVRGKDEQLEAAEGLVSFIIQVSLSVLTSSNQRFRVTEALSRSDRDAKLPGDILLLRLHPTYQVFYHVVYLYWILFMLLLADPPREQVSEIRSQHSTPAAQCQKRRCT